MAARFVCVLLVFGGCAGPKAESPPPHEVEAPAESATPADSPAPPEAAPPPAAAAAATAPAATGGGITRRELLSVLDQSPGAFLQHVDVTPRFGGGRFIGWRVVSFFPGDARFAAVDLQAGDVVHTINGLPVEKPEQLMVVWQALRSATALEVALERNGVARTLRWPIGN